MLAVVLLGGCATPEERQADLRATWRGAKVMMPRDPDSTTLIYRGSAASWTEAVAAAGVTPRARVPAVVHLHGCRGQDSSDPRLGSLYASHGYAFFGPNSFARSGRQVLCDRGQMDGRMAMRLEEAQYALAQLHKIDWIDPQRIVLSGFSEGAQAASSYAGRQFAAIVLLGTDCRFVGHRPRAPLEVPVINIVGSADHYGYGRGCARHGAPGSRKVVIRDGQHDLSLDEEAMRALAQFLSERSR